MLQLLISTALTVFTLFCIYTAYITGRSGNMESAWFFIAFSLLFVIPLIIMICRYLAQRNFISMKFYEKLAGPQQDTLRFVPHWVMMLIIIIVIIIGTVNIFRIFFH